ncbi:MAG: hypothetical protein ACRDGG_03895 [Anaerolineae bacterium]
MLTETRYEPIVLDDQGRPIIAGTTMKVAEYERLRAASRPSPLIEKLKARGLIQ